MQELKREQSLSTGTLVGEIVHDAHTLIRQELELAKMEVTQEITKGKRALLAFSTANSLRTIALFHLSLGMAFILNQVLDVTLWLSFLIISAIASALAYWLYRNAVSRIDAIDLLPKQAIDTMKENVEWIKARVKS